MKIYKEEEECLTQRIINFYHQLKEEDHDVNQNKRLFIEIIFLNILYE